MKSYNFIVISSDGFACFFLYFICMFNSQLIDSLGEGARVFISSDNNIIIPSRIKEHKYDIEGKHLPLKLD